MSNTKLIKLNIMEIEKIEVTTTGSVPENLLKNFMGFDGYISSNKICRFIDEDIRYYVQRHEAHGDFNKTAGGSLWSMDGEMTWSIDIKLNN